MAQLIGGQEVAGAFAGYGTRSQAPSLRILPENDTSGLQSLAGALQRTGATGQSYLDRRIREEKEKEGFGALQKWNTFQGEFVRTIEQAKLSQPIDGSGYGAFVEKEFDAGYKTFLESIPAVLRPEYEARAEGFKQDALLRADTFSREMGRQWSLTSVNRAVDDAKLEVYQNPDANLDDSVGEIIAAAPFMTEQEKEALAHSTLKELRGAAMGGRIRNGRERSYVTPYSAEVSERVIPALIGTESSGDPNAVSPKGAQGLMQVMPGTARMIAQDLRDQSYPFKDGLAAEEAYLKRPDINLLYGTFHFNDLLKNYGGDLELALIAYNAGPGRANTYRDSGRDWASLPSGVQKETKPYVEKIMGATGALTPEMAFNPEFGLDFEQATAAEGAIEEVEAQTQRNIAQAEADARANIAQAKAAAAAQHDAASTQLYARAEAGEDGRAIYLNEIADGRMQYDRETMNNVIGVSKRVNEERMKDQAAFSALMAGDGMTEDQGDRIITPDLRAGLLQRDDTAINTIVQRTASIGFTPPAAANLLSQMLFSPDIRDVSAAAQTLGAIESRNPGALRGVNEDALIRAQSFKTMNDARIPADVIQQNLDATRLPEQRRALEGRKKADTEYEKNKFISTEDMTSFFETRFQNWLPFTGGVETPATPEMAVQFQMQYAAVYDATYNTTGDAALARRAALEHTAKSWAPSDAGGGVPRLSWLPPELALTNFSADVDGDGQLETVQQTPDQAKASFEQAVRAQYGITNFQAYAIPETKRALDSGKPIPYAIIPLDEDGNVHWGTSELIQLLSGQPFSYDYGQIAVARTVLINNRELLQTQLEDLQRQNAPFTAGQNPELEQRILDTEMQLQEVLGKLGQ